MESTEQKIVSKGSKFVETTSREIERNADKEEPLESKEEIKDGGSFYPFRLLKPDCAFYVRTGYCRYGGACRFNHPLREMEGSWSASRPRQNLLVSTSSSSTSYVGLSARVSTPTKSEDTVSQQVSTEHPKSRVQFNLPAVNTLSNIRDTPAMIKSDVTNNLQANTEEHPRSRVQFNLPLSSSSSSSKDNVRYIAHAKVTTMSGNAINQQANTDEHPKSQVQFNHPNARPIRAPIVAVSPMGLPLRPDQPVCMFYSRYGLCKDGIGCQHDHPVGYGTAVAQSSNQTPASRDTGNNANK